MPVLLRPLLLVHWRDQTEAWPHRVLGTSLLMVVVERVVFGVGPHQSSSWLEAQAMAPDHTEAVQVEAAHQVPLLGRLATPVNGTGVAVQGPLLSVLVALPMLAATLLAASSWLRSTTRRRNEQLRRN